VLVGCRSDKKDTDEPVPAEEVYTSAYFAEKRRWTKLYPDDWAAVPLYLVRHTSGHVATVASRDGRTDQPWRLRVHNDVELPRKIESALTGDDPTLVPRSSVPDVEAVEWATSQSRLAAWGV